MLLGGVSQCGDGLSDGPARCPTLTSALGKGGSHGSGRCAGSRSQVYPLQDRRGPQSCACDPAVMTELKQCLESVYSAMGIENSKFQFLLQNFKWSLGHFAAYTFLYV